MLAGQLTIVGVVFPIVVGFVGNLLESKSANRALWNVYSQYSGFMFCVSSGIGLSIFILLLQYSFPWRSIHIDIAVSVVILGWFIFNLFITGWFLTATYRFMSPKHRLKMLSRFSVNETFIRDIKSKLWNLIPQSAERRELFGKIKKNQEVYVDLLSNQSVVDKFEKIFKSPKYIAQIRYRILWFLIKIHSAKRKIEESEGSTIFLPARPRARPQKEFLIAATSNKRLSSVEKIIARTAFSFSKSFPHDDESLEFIILLIFGSVEDALKDKNERLFQIALEEARDWLLDVSFCLSFINDYGDEDNWLLLKDSEIFGVSYAKHILQEFMRIVKSIFENYPESHRTFQVACYFYPMLFSESSRNDYFVMGGEYLLGHASIWPLLAASNQSSKNFESNVVTFVGSWESWHFRLSFEKEHENEFKFFNDHLFFTCRFLIQALREGNDVASEWAADMVIHWLDNSHLEINRLSPWMNSSVLTAYLLEKPREDSLWQAVFQNGDYSYLSAKKGAISNLWFDLRLALSTYILLKPDFRSSAINRRIIFALVKEERLRPTGAIENTYFSVNRGNEILESWFRVTCNIFDDDNKYNRHIDRFVFSLSNIDESPKVSGRVYSGWGGFDLNDLKDYYQAMMITFSERPWALSMEWNQLIVNGVLDFDVREKLILNCRRMDEISDSTINIVKDLVESDDVDKRIENFKISLSGIIEQIERYQFEVIVNSEIDQARLDELADQISTIIEGEPRKNIPISLFGKHYLNKDVTELPANPYKLNITGIPKADFAVGLKGNRPINEADSAAVGIISHVCNMALRKIYQLAQSAGEFTDRTELLSRILQDVKDRRDGTDAFRPVMLVSSWKLVEVIDPPRDRATSDQRFPVSHLDGFPDGYVCHVDGIEVYSVGAGSNRFALLFDRNALEEISFRRYPGHSLVKCSFEQDELNAHAGRLAIEVDVEMKIDEKSWFCLYHDLG
ncbi:hypothetical protein [Marinobacter salarius]|uniref:hypothetical protein n=1 Tax=Marinobacter salarius TaxID=1420917 RepID=UPI0012F9532E|nr:hypothetical protein [Marinobacter salarius]